MLQAYRLHAAERAALGIPPLPLDALQTAALIELVKSPPSSQNPGEDAFLLDLLTHRVPPGVDDAAKVKASFLAAVAHGDIAVRLLSKAKATELLGTMVGGYNVHPLIELLDDAEAGVAAVAAAGLKKTLLMFDFFNDVADKARATNPHTAALALEVMNSWAAAEWFTTRPEVPRSITVSVFKVPGETNTDDLSPAPDAWSRPDIPLHYLAMLKNTRPGAAFKPEEDGKRGPMQFIDDLKARGHLVAYVGDVVGTGSSRKSATNSAVWATGQDIPFVPNKRYGGITLGGKIAPIYFNTQEDAGSLPIEVDVGQLEMGDVIDIHPYDGKIVKDGAVVATFQIRSDVIFDEVRAGGRINLIIGRSLTAKAREFLGLPASTVFRLPTVPHATKAGYTLAQKMVGRAVGLPEVSGTQQGVRPGTYCEPKMTSIGSQDTTGTMTRDELKDLACLGFSADLVMQSFCHTAAYPKKVDVQTHRELPSFMSNRGGISLRPGDGIIHSWLNRMLLPDTVGTGGDSHTRFPIGISFPAGSGLVAFGAATGVMPLDMPESVLVRFTGTMQPGVTLRDLVHAIPLFAIRQGLLTVAKSGKVNEFSGRILEIEGLPDLKVEQAFELSDASAERSAAGCTIKLDKAPIIEYLNSNVVLLKNMIAQGYADKRSIERRIVKMQEWLAHPSLLEADADAEYAHVLEIDMNQIKEPILCCPNDPDDAKFLSEVAGTKIDEAFIGSCMTNIGHFRAASKLLEGRRDIPVKLWVAPPTKMDQDELTKEGHYANFGAAGARTEMPGCSLCMGNQAQVREGATVVSTSTRNFPNRLGKNSNVFLASAELAAIASRLGKLPTVAEYADAMGIINADNASIYKYMNFDQIDEYAETAKGVSA